MRAVLDKAVRCRLSALLYT